jgi:hypothetical protein
MSGDQEVLSAELDSIQPAMDSVGLTLTARYGDGRPAAVEAICLRPVLPLTRAEAMARANWPGARDQPEVPGPRRPLLVGARGIFPPVRAADPVGAPRRRRVCIYQHFSVLLAQRRRRLRERRPAPPQRAVAPGDGPANA